MDDEGSLAIVVAAVGRLLCFLEEETVEEATRSLGHGGHKEEETRSKALEVSGLVRFAHDSVLFFGMQSYEK